MPRYDFRCAPCQWTFEIVLPFGSPELPKCPQCGKRVTEKLVSPPMGIHFRGSGFYKTDSRPVEKKAPSPEKSPAPAPHHEPSLPAGRQVPKGEGTVEAPKTEKPKEAPQKDKKSV